MRRTLKKNSFTTYYFNEFVSPLKILLKWNWKLYKQWYFDERFFIELRSWNTGIYLIIFYFNHVILINYISGYKYLLKYLNVKSMRRTLKRNWIFVFILQRYVENVKQDASIGTNILRVSASDEDADNNGAIVYSLSSPNNEQNLEYFEIQPESGWIVLKKPLDVSIPIKIADILHIVSL